MFEKINIAFNSSIMYLSYYEIKVWTAIRRSRNRKTDAIILTYGRNMKQTGVYKIKFKR
jgi:hypothetical protein